MEQGTLASGGSRERVLDALGEIYGGSAETLREIGQPMGEGRGPAGAPAMARKARLDPDYALEARPEDGEESRPEPVAPARERDEIDELFTGGP